MNPINNSRKNSAANKRDITNISSNNNENENK